MAGQTESAAAAVPLVSRLRQRRTTLALRDNHNRGAANRSRSKIQHARWLRKCTGHRAATTQLPDRWRSSDARHGGERVASVGCKCTGWKWRGSSHRYMYVCMCTRGAVCGRRITTHSQTHAATGSRWLRGEPSFRGCGLAATSGGPIGTAKPDVQRPCGRGCRGGSRAGEQTLALGTGCATTGSAATG